MVEGDDDDVDAPDLRGHNRALGRNRALEPKEAGACLSSGLRPGCLDCGWLGGASHPLGWLAEGWHPSDSRLLIIERVYVPS